MKTKPFRDQVAIITGGGTGIWRAFSEALRDDVRKSGANIRVFNFCPGLVDVDQMKEEEQPRAGAIHVRNMAHTLLYALSLDRDVVLEDINLYAR